MARPPMSSDSEEDEYEGFSFGNEFEKRTRNGNANPSQSLWLVNQQRENEDLNRLVLIVKNGDLEGMKQELLRRYGSETRINYNEYLKDGWTLMLHAVSNLQFHIVRYLISKGANVNCEADSLTPLMLICKQEAYPSQIDDVINMVKLLLEQGGVVNVRDKTGCTPFMYACAFGNNDIVDLLLNLSAIDATDNFGKTPLHYAVENRHFDIVKMLLNAGADIEVYNSEGLTPYQVAISLALTDIEELFPEEITDCLPVSADQYKTYQDIAPLIFPEHNKSAYSQDIPRMLRGMRVDNCAQQFYKEKVSLSHFLTMDDNDLQSLGINFEYQRKRILLGLLKFHGHAFSPKSIEFVSDNKQKNTFEYFEMYACYLKHLVIMKAAIDYLWKIGGVKINGRSEQAIKEMIASVEKIQDDLLLLQKIIQKISANSTKNPLFIGPATHQSQRYKKVITPFLKYTTFIGMGIFLSIKLIKLIPA